MKHGGGGIMLRKLLLLAARAILKENLLGSAKHYEWVWGLATSRMFLNIHTEFQQYGLDENILNAQIHTKRHWIFMLEP